MSLTYLVTGASRGLGLGYVRGLLASSPSVKLVAAARNPESSDGLTQLASEYKDRIHLLKLDIEDAKGAKEAAKQLEESGFLGEGGLDFLLASAGVALGSKAPTETTVEDFESNFKVNLYGSLNTVQAFLPLVKKSKTKKIGFVSSTLGSIEFSGQNDMYTAYSVSKVALNLYAKKLSVELGKEGFTVFMMCPGYVATDLNNHQGALTVDHAVSSALKNIFLSADTKNGEFIRENGERIAW